MKRRHIFALQFLRWFTSYNCVTLCIQALLPTRRWFNTLLDDSHLVVNCHLSNLPSREKEGHLFCQVRTRTLVDQDSGVTTRRVCELTFYFLFIFLFRPAAVGHAEVLHRVRDQRPDRKRPDAEGDDHAAL